MKIGTAIRTLWQRQRVALIAFTLALAVALFFALRLVFSTIYWADPAHRTQAPEAWMTVGYVARSWQVDRGALAQALGLTPKPGRPRSLEKLAHDRGMTLDAFLTEVAAEAALLRAAKP